MLHFRPQSQRALTTPAGLIALACLIQPWQLHAGQNLGQSSAVTQPGVATRELPQVIVPNIGARRWYASPVVVSQVNVTMNITEQVSATTIELTLTNPHSVAQEAELLLPVPDGVVVRSLSYDGVGPEPTATVLRREEAKKIYESIVRSMRDPALVEFVGSNVIKTSAFPIPAGGSQKVSLTYEQVLAADGQRVDFVLPRTESLALDVPWSIKGTISGRGGISTVYSPTHQLTHERISDLALSFKVNGSQGGDRGSFRLSYLMPKSDVNEPTFTVMAYPENDGGYFMILGGLPLNKRTGQVTTPREVTLVLDRSGSMRNGKIEQAKEAAKQIIAGLRPGERFNLIDYSDSISSFAAQPVEVTPEVLKRAEMYVQAIEANGGTNIHDALLESLRPQASTTHLPLVLFLTDGLATIGQTGEVQIREAVSKANTAKRRIFTFGVGFDVNVPLLSGLADATRGASTFVLPDEDVEVKVSQVYRRLAGPVFSMPALAQVNAADGVSGISQFFPRSLPDIYEGDQVIIFGQYRGTSTVHLSLSGEFFGKQTSFSFSFDPAAASTSNAFVARLWAERKITFLVDQIRQAGAQPGSMPENQTKELVDEIVRLSTRYGILTEYTAFLASENQNLRDADGDGVADAAAAPAAGLLQLRAAETRAGSAAVNQQLDYARKSNAQRVDASPTWVNEKMEVETVRSIQNVGDRSYFKRGNRWVDSQLVTNEGQAPTREVIAGSAEFFTLAELLAKDGRQSVLTFEGEIYLLVGAERILVLPAAKP